VQPLCFTVQRGAVVRVLMTVQIPESPRKWYSPLAAVFIGGDEEDDDKNEKPRTPVPTTKKEAFVIEYRKELVRCGKMCPSTRCPPELSVRSHARVQTAYRQKASFPFATVIRPRA
jgi:hypothetical protein